MKMYSVRDNKAGYFFTPFVSRNDVVAMRDFKAGIADPSSGSVHHYPSDFDLFCLADVDEDTGVVIPEGQPRFICNGGITLKEASE